MTEQRYEQSGSDVLLWALWGGLIFATVGEVVLFSFMGAKVGPGTVGSLPLSQFALVGGFSLVMTILAFVVKARDIAGGGFPTALIAWVLLKSVAITGLVVYQLADNHTYYWPFIIVFAVGFALLNPGAFDS